MHENFRAGWRHALRSERPFIIIIIKRLLYWRAGNSDVADGRVVGESSPATGCCAADDEELAWVRAWTKDLLSEKWSPPKDECEVSCVTELSDIASIQMCKMCKTE